MTEAEKVVMQAIEQSSNTFDLTEQGEQERLFALANKLCCLKDIPIDYFKQVASQDGCPLEFKLAVKLVESRRYLLKVTQPISIGIVFAMWGEQNRLMPKSKQNPNGEDSLNVKIAQLNWVTQGTPVEWHLYPVDDGCPHNSAGIAQSIASENTKSDQITVMRLEEAVPTSEGPLSHLPSADDSRKGGAIIYGCQKAVQDGNDCVVYTDADNSVHLGQLGLLIEPYIKEDAKVVLGNRKHPDSILVKQEERWGVGIKTLRHMQRMIGRSIFTKGIKDTQAAFKLYDKHAVNAILEAPSVYDFSFDTDWILASMEKGYQITTVPFAFIDSAAESASIVQGPMTTWYTLLHGLAKAAHDRHADHDVLMAQVFEEEVKSHKDLELIIDLLPAELRDAKESDLGNPKLMSPMQLKQWLVSVKSRQPTIV
ncbi:glycosyltransferase [Thaumasiovibrio sp. DFM-14]|uniref:glycosyltransferase n=1 Tax=Thaumasiovibrio sp. DFM-14 TaxID=3384792 RepID=UPI0039A03AE5